MLCSGRNCLAVSSKNIKQCVTEKGFSKGVLIFHLVLAVTSAGVNSRPWHSPGPELCLVGSSLNCECLKYLGFLDGVWNFFVEKGEILGDQKKKNSLYLHAAKGGGSQIDTWLWLLQVTCTEWLFWLYLLIALEGQHRTSSLLDLALPWSDPHPHFPHSTQQVFDLKQSELLVNSEGDRHLVLGGFCNSSLYEIWQLQS